jgi:tRNA-dihydrouridine synthase B
MLKRPILRGNVNFPVTLAPMVGLSHAALRRVVKSYMPSSARTLWPTEMLNSRRLPHENFAVVPEVRKFADETNLVPQILGNEAMPIQLSCARLESEWGASGIDVNMGCPVRKAIAHNYGVSLMGDEGYAREVVAMTRAATKLPISVKLRAGPQGDPEFMKRFSRGLIEAGAEWLTLHPRTAEQKRRGRADWSLLRDLRENVDVAVIGNGDVQLAEDVVRMLKETDVDAVMIGRAATARPWIFWQLGEEWGWPEPTGREGQRAPRSPDEEGREYGRMLLEFIDALEAIYPLPHEDESDLAWSERVAAGAKPHWSEDLVLRKLRFFVKNGAAWLSFGLDLEARLSRCKTLREARTTVQAFFQQDIAMTSRTELRY